jgi:hypothetical protein
LRQLLLQAILAMKAPDQRMGKTLAQGDFSFKAKTMRVYQDGDGDYLHIVHNINVLAARPDKITITATGDDGTTKLVYDGQQVSVFDAADNKYAQVPITGNLQHMLDEVSERLGVDFPLADLFGGDPTQSFLTGVISGKEVDTEPDRNRRPAQRRVDAVMIFSENLQREPALELPQCHGRASFGRIGGPVLDARKCRSAQDVHGPHGRPNKALDMPAEMRLGDRPVDHLDTEILKCAGESR